MTRRTTMVSMLATVSLLLTGVGLASSAPPAEAADAQPGLRGDYFTVDAANDFALDELQSSVIDGAIDYPSMRPVYERNAGAAEQVGVRWTGDLVVEEAGDYSFAAIGDNGFRLWVDDELLIDFWEDDWDVEQQSPTVALDAGSHDFRFELFQNEGGAHIQLRWTGPGIDDEVIPASAFTLPDDFDVISASAEVDVAGTTVAAAFDGAVVGSDASLEHVEVLADGDALPLDGLSVEDGVLRVHLGTPVQQGVLVRIAYDGEGDLALDGAPLGAFDVPAVNVSDYRMATEWAEDVDPEAPLQEYPRPQLVREDWVNLNGQWEFQALDEGESAPFGVTYDEQVTVPYPIESMLSGIERMEDHFAYRRDLTVPADWGIGEGQRLELQFGAVDYEAWVYVNGTEVAHHTGGYDAFSVDVTDALVGTDNELVVQVADPTIGVPRGKQDLNPSGIFYTSSSGIWQTVWMEPVPEVSVDELELTPDLDASALLVTAEADGDVPVEVTVSADGEQVATATGSTNEELALVIDDPRLWSPDDPFLYDVAVTAGDDVLTSYAGMRSIEVAEVDGVQRILLNGEQTYLLSTLDQGYWPDGISTAPTDEALAWDIEQTQALGFNTIRKHIKVEPARWYYHADVLGMIVWQDMPADNGGNRDEASQENYRDELMRMVDQLDSFTSIVGWVPFNEGWGEWDLDETGEIADAVGEADPSRLVIAHSGVNCCASLGDSGRGDVIDWHEYGDYGPAFPQPDATRAAVDGEHGGLSLSVPGRVWPGGSVNPYGEVANSEELTAGYVENTARLIGAAQTFLSGSVYTQITDVEGEVNGFWTYDRAVLKVDLDQVRAINQLVIALGSGEAPPGEPVGGEEGLAHWSLDEGEGATSADASGFDHDLTLGDGATWTTGESDDDPALQLADGAQATAEVPELDTTGAFTVASWVRLDELPESYATFASADGVTGQSSFYLQYGEPIDGFGMSFAGGPRAVAEIDPELGTWYHLAGVYDPESHTLRLYLDGELVDEVSGAGGTLTTGTIALGRGQWDGDEVDFLDGAVDDVRLFDRALDDDEVIALVEGEPEPDVEVTTLSGSNRWGTSAAVSEASFEPGSSVFLASGASYADALAAGPAAAHAGASLLLTAQGDLPAATLAELDRLQPPAITIVGGTAAIGPDVEAALAERFPDADIERISGVNRFATAAAVATEVFGEASTAFVASGQDFADALSASGVAATLDGVPVLLASQAAATDVTTDALAQLGVTEAVVVGGTAVLSEPVVEAVGAVVDEVSRVSGSDRFVTNAELVDAFVEPTSPQGIVMASGASFPDALSATAVSGTTGAPLLLTPGSCVTQVTADAVAALAPTSVVNVGGSAALSPEAWQTTC